MIRCRIVCASQAQFITLLNQKGISSYYLTPCDELTTLLSVRRKDYKAVCALGKQYGAEIQIVNERDLFYQCSTLLKRPILMIGLCLWAILVCYLPTRILFVTVSGNASIPEKQILESAEDCGIYFGAARKTLRSEKVKNALISQISRLEWVGVNTYGCIAEIMVQEKSSAEEPHKYLGVTSLIAGYDGVVCEVVAKQGTALCVPGQAVSKGETLISGFTDCGFTTRAERSVGTVYAYTTRSLKVYFPVSGEARREVTGRNSRFSLKIGKNIINLSLNSGISGTGCAKIYEENCIKLPGGFCLPISLIRETEFTYSTVSKTAVQWSKISSMPTQYLHSQMIDGSILHHNYECSSRADIIFADYSFYCKEMIARERKEEMPLWVKK